MKLRSITPGQVVYQELGQTAAAKACGVSESTVWRWAQKRPRGTGGVVPSGHHLTLLALSHKLGRPMTADDLVFGRHKRKG